MRRPRWCGRPRRVASPRGSRRMRGAATFPRRRAAVLEHRLTRLVRVREHGRIDMHHDLVPLTRRTRIELMMERGFRDECERVRCYAPPGRVWNAPPTLAGAA